MKHVEVALAIILDRTGQKVVVAQRPEGVHLGGMWEFPGGKIETGETASECAIREAQEEVGLDVAVIEAWTPVAFAYPDRTVTLFAFECRSVSEELRTLESGNARWADIVSLDEARFPPANVSILAALKGSAHKADPGA